VSSSKKLRGTELRPSPLVGHIPRSAREPAILTKDDPRNVHGIDPLIAAFDKQAKTFKGLKNPELEPVRKELVCMLLERLSGDGARVLPLRDAFKGDSASGLKPVDMTTSPGNKYRKYGSDKRGLLDENREPCAMVVADMESLVEQALNKKLLNVYSTASIKDEVRVPEKIASVSSRLLSNGNLDFDGLCRAYLGPFCAAMIRAGPSAFNAMGINVYSASYDRMIRDFIQISRDGFGGDFKGYCYTAHYDMIMALGSVAEAWYEKWDTNRTNEDILVREAIFRAMGHSVELCRGAVFIVEGCIPSGVTTTTVFNCLMNLIYLLYGYRWCYERARKEDPTNPFWGQFPGWSGFHAFVRAIVFGDDHMLTVGGFVKTFFHFSGMRDAMTSLGITYTNPQKDGKDPEDLVDIEDLEFLSNTPRFDTQMNAFLACAKEEGAWTSLNWIRGHDQPDEVLIAARAQDVLQRVWGHGPETWHRMHDMIVGGFQRSGLVPPSFWRFDDLTERYRHGILGMANPDEIGFGYDIEAAPSFVVEPQMDSGVVLTGPKSSTVAVGGVSGAKVGGVGFSMPQTPAKNSFSTVLERPQFQGTVTWSVAQAENTPILSAEMPYEALKGPHLRAVEVFKYMRWQRAVVTITTQGQPFMAGRLMALAVPNAATLEVDEWVGPLVSKCVNQHAFIDPSKTETIVFSVPWNYPYQAFDLTGGPGQLPVQCFQLVVFNRLRTGAAGPTSVTVTWMVHYEGLELAVLRPPPPLMPKKDSAVSELEAKIEELERALQKRKSGSQSGGGIKLIPQGASASKTTNIQNVTNNYDHVVNSNFGPAGAEDAISTDQKSSADVKAQDKPIVSLTPLANTPMAPRITGASNFVQATPMCYTVSALGPPASAGSFGVDKDEMDISTLLSQPSLVGTIQLDTSQTVGHVLLEAPLSPATSLYNMQLSKQATLNLLSWIVAPHAFWRGDLTITLMPVKTPFHSAKVAVALLYGVNSVAETDASALEQYATIIDLASDSTTVEVKVPFNMPVNRCRVYNGGDQDDYVASLHSMGTLVVFVYAPLVAPETVSNVIDINVYYELSADSLLDFWGTNNPTVQVEPVQSLLEHDDVVLAPGFVVEPQGDTAGGDDEQKIISDPVPGDSGVPLKHGAPLSLKSYGARGFVVADFLTTKSDTEFTIPVGSLFVPFNHLSQEGHNIHASGFAFVAQAFRAWIGPIVLYALGNFDGVISVSPYADSRPSMKTAFTTVANQGAMNRSPEQTTTGSSAATIAVCPWFGRNLEYALVPMRPEHLQDNLYSPGVFRILIRGTPEPRHVSFAMALGDTTRLFRPFRVPRMILGATALQGDKYANDPTPVTLPVNITVEHDVQEPAIPVSAQEMRSAQDYTFVQAATVANLPWEFSAVQFGTAGLTSATLRALGFDVADGQPRNYSGSATRWFNLSRYLGAPASLTVDYDDGLLLHKPAFDVPVDIASPVVTQGLKHGPTGTFHTVAWENKDWLEAYMGIPNTRVGIPIHATGLLTMSVGLKKVTANNIPLGLLTIGDEPTALDRI
jgi:hypothetical protein